MEGQLNITGIIGTGVSADILQGNGNSYGQNVGWIQAGPTQGWGLY
jgi:hypothetical protein